MSEHFRGENNSKGTIGGKTTQRGRKRSTTTINSSLTYFS